MIYEAYFFYVEHLSERTDVRLVTIAFVGYAVICFIDIRSSR